MVNRFGRLKSLVESLVPSQRPTYVYLRESCRAFWLRKTYMESVFSLIYRDNSWGSDESVSGPGSTLARTDVIRQELPALLESIRATSLLDAACGDFNWMRYTRLKGVNYIGADIVPELIARNQRLYGAEGRQFMVSDISKDPLPTVDLILCRECFIHFSFRCIGSALRNFKRSGSTYLLATTHPTVRVNQDIATGQWRPVNLQLPPFQFPCPLVFITEDVEAGKCLGLWKLRTL